MKGLKTYLSRHSPIILSCIGAAGVVATAVLAVQATPRAMKLCEALRLDRVNDYQEEPTKIEYVKEAWKCYIPTAIVGTSTILCIFGANVLSRKQQAAITGAYIFLDQSYREYKAKVEEMVGKDGEAEVRGAIVKDHYKETDIFPLGEKLLFYIEHQDRFFERTMLEVREAEYQINRKLAEEGCVSLNDFFEFLDLPKTNVGAILGWSQESNFENYGHFWIDFEHEILDVDDDMECYVINMVYPPVATFIPF